MNSGNYTLNAQLCERATLESPGEAENSKQFIWYRWALLNSETKYNDITFYVVVEIFPNYSPGQISNEKRA